MMLGARLHRRERLGLGKGTRAIAEDGAHAKPSP